MFSVLVERTNSSEAMTNFGRDEYMAERFPRSSWAIFPLLMITMVWPITVTELIGPVALLEIYLRRG